MTKAVRQTGGVLGACVRTTGWIRFMTDLTEGSDGPKVEEEERKSPVHVAAWKVILHGESIDGG